MEQKMQGTLNQLKEQSIQVTDATNKVLTTVVETMESEFEGDIAFDQQTLSFVKQVNDNFVVTVSKNYDRGVVIAHLLRIGNQQPVSECTVSVTGIITETMEFIPDAEIRTKIKGWFDKLTEAAWAMFAPANAPAEAPVQEVPVEQAPTQEDIPSMEADVVGIQH